MSRPVKLWFDGGWRPATGMEIAVVAASRTWIERDLGPGSAMAAEWLALIRAVEISRELGLTDPLFLGDALAVIGQAGGRVRCPDACHPYAETLAALSPSLRLRYVKRSQNLAGIALARARTY